MSTRFIPQRDLTVYALLLSSLRAVRILATGLAVFVIAIALYRADSDGHRFRSIAQQAGDWFIVAFDQTFSK